MLGLYFKKGEKKKLQTESETFANFCLEQTRADAKHTSRTHKHTHTKRNNKCLERVETFGTAAILCLQERNQAKHQRRFPSRMKVCDAGKSSEAKTDACREAGTRAAGAGRVIRPGESF